MKELLLALFMVLCCSSMIFAQKDTVAVLGFYESGGVAPDNYGTLNDAIEAAVAAGTINNTVFKLTPYEVYVLNRSIFMDNEQNLDIVAPEAGTTQESAPPQIVWTEEDIDRAYIIQSHGDVIMKNIWVRFADFTGSQVSTSITFENQNEANDPEIGYFEGCIFDYAGIGAEAGGAITVKADHFDGEFQDCYFRNLTDFHFRWYGRAVSFPFQSTGWHYDRLLFENTTFSNMSRIVMQEGNEWSDNLHINHCTIVNSLDWLLQTNGWMRNASVTNSVFVNPKMIGLRVVDVCDEGQDLDDYQNGLCDGDLDGGLIDFITPVDSFGFDVDFTDADRQLFIGNNTYLYQDYMVDWFENCDPWCLERIQQRESDLLSQPNPMVGTSVSAWVDSVDENGNKVFTTMNIDLATIYDIDPEFVEPATNQDTMLTFVMYKWDANQDIDWSYRPNAGFNQTWPLPENMNYANTQLQTAAMGGFPLGDLNWFPDQKPAWEAQRDDEWVTINNWLTTGNPGGTSIAEVPVVLPSGFTLEQNYPNPFNPSTAIEYSIPRTGDVSLKVFNTVGQEVATLFSGRQTAGTYQTSFNGKDLASGEYFYRLRFDDEVITRKLILLK